RRPRRRRPGGAGRGRSGGSRTSPPPGRPAPAIRQAGALRRRTPIPADSDIRIGERDREAPIARAAPLRTGEETGWTACPPERSHGRPATLDVPVEPAAWRSVTPRSGPRPRWRRTSSVPPRLAQPPPG